MEQAEFDSTAYLRSRFDLINEERVIFPLQKFHEEFAKLPGSLQILDYGTGPVIMTLISAAPHASEITLVEYDPRNRELLCSWLEDKGTNFDWSPFFDHVVQTLEGRGEEEARAREALVRKVVKRVVSCDFTSFPIIEKGSEGPYDVVISSCCIDVCRKLEQFKANLRNVSDLVRPGGTLMLFLSERRMVRECGVYYIGSTELGIINITASYVADQMREMGLNDVKSYSYRGDRERMKKIQDEDYLGYMFLIGIKS